MSARYSSSPELRLRIGKSRLRSALYGALCLTTLYALWGIYARGYPALCLLLTLFALTVLWRLRGDSRIGDELCWRRGCWTLERAGVLRAISPGTRSTATPWVIYLEFSDLPDGPGGRLWLFADCAPSQQLRQLRVRLALLR